MHVLVSVSDATDARAALEAGADIIDAKDPAAGALGAVPVETLRAVHGAVNGRRPVSTALGDAVDERSIEESARVAAALGSAFVKLAFAGQPDTPAVVRLLEAARRGAAGAWPSPVHVVAAAYADWKTARTGPSPARVIEAAGRGGASGVLIDTADKTGPGLFEHASHDTLADWVRNAHALGLWVALAGRLREDDLAAVAALGADVVGFRGAVCEGGRTGRLSHERVRRVMRTCAALFGERSVSERVTQSLDVVAGHTPG